MHDNKALSLTHNKMGHSASIRAEEEGFLEEAWRRLFQQSVSPDSLGDTPFYVKARIFLLWVDY